MLDHLSTASKGYKMFSSHTPTAALCIQYVQSILPNHLRFAVHHLRLDHLRVHSLSHHHRTLHTPQPTNNVPHPTPQPPASQEAQASLSKSNTQTLTRRAPHPFLPYRRSKPLLPGHNCHRQIAFTSGPQSTRFHPTGLFRSAGSCLSCPSASATANYHNDTKGGNIYG